MRMPLHENIDALVNCLYAVLLIRSRSCRYAAARTVGDKYRVCRIAPAAYNRVANMHLNIVTAIKTNTIIKLETKATIDEVSKETLKVISKHISIVDINNLQVYNLAPISSLPFC